MAEKSRAQSVQQSSSEREKQGQNKNPGYSNSSAQPEWLGQALEMPSRARPEDVLALQRRFGNQVVQRVLDSTIQRQPVANKDGRLRQDIAAEIQSASQGGQPISGTLREEMSQQLGHDFSTVRIHTGRRADTLARQLQARAFTLGNSIFFSQGAYDPQSAAGRHTLAHELTHVVQQSGSSAGGPLKLGQPDDRYEQEADRVAASQVSASESGLAAGAGAVQRLPSWKKIKGFFGSSSSGGQGGGSPAPTVQQGGSPAPTSTVQQGGSPAPVPQQGGTTTTTTTTTPPQQPVEPVPQDVTLEDWQKLKANGVPDIAAWDRFSEEGKQTIFLALASSPGLVQFLVECAKHDQWPVHPAGADLWSLTLIDKLFVPEKITVAAWNLLGERRTPIVDCLSNSAVPLGYELITAARKNYWPKNGADADILQKDVIVKIKNKLKTPLSVWGAFAVGKRAVILDAQAADADRAAELAKAAAAGVWPKDGAGQDLTAYAPWGLVKDAVPALTPAQWNKFDMASRGNILSAATQEEKKRLIYQARSARKSQSTRLEKAGEFFENPIIEGISGTAGTASSITGAMENDKASGIVGASADAADTLVQGFSLLGSISKYRRGSRLDQKGLTSRAAQTQGKKEKRAGLWGMAQSTLGLGGSISSMTGNISKGNNPDKDEESGFSETTDKVSGSFAIGAGAMGSVKGGMGLFRSFRRSSKTKGFIQENATGDAKKLSDIASFTQSKQNRLGRFFETFKGVSTVLGGVASIIGDDVFGSVMGGLGLAGGIAQAVSTKVGAPNETELEQKAADLVGLLQAKNAEAIRFAKEVLNIKDVTPDTPDGWAEWAAEDPQAAKNLIKSKLSKHG